MSPGNHHEERFRRVYADCFPAMLAYALRRVERPEDAADVVAETFLVAWRRGAEMPDGDEARLWLYGVARRVLSNQHRGDRRREQLGARLRSVLTFGGGADPGVEVPERLDVHAALRRLGELDREVLTLTVWEGLRPREVAAVLRLSPGAVRTRLSRARAQLRALIGDDAGPAGHVLDVLTASRNPGEAR